MTFFTPDNYSDFLTTLMITVTNGKIAVCGVSCPLDFSLLSHTFTALASSICFFNSAIGSLGGLMGVAVGVAVGVA